MVSLSSLVNFSVRQSKWVYYSAIVMLWCKLIGYSAAVYAPERGLQPVGGWPNLLSYAAFYAAVVGATIATAIFLNNALREARRKHA